MSFIFTNHALNRIQERKISQSLTSQTLNNPDAKFEENSVTKFRKVFGSQTATAIVKKNELGENVVLSFWLDPPNPGTRDYKIYKRKKDLAQASTIKRFLITFLNQIGL